MRLVLSGCQTRSLNLSARIVNVSIEALTGFSHVDSLDGLNNTLLSEGEVAPSAGTIG